MGCLHALGYSSVYELLDCMDIGIGAIIYHSAMEAL